MAEENNRNFLGRFFNKETAKPPEQRRGVELFLSFAEKSPSPLCFFNKKESLAYGNDAFFNNFKGESLLKTTKESFFKEEIKENNFLFSRNRKIWSVKKRNRDDNSTIYYFTDISKEISIEKKFEKTKSAIVLLSVDNYDEIMARTPDEKKGDLSTIIETKIREFARENHGAIIRYKVDRYIIIFKKENIVKLKKDKFSILEQIKNIEVEAEVPVTLSIGVGMENPSPQTNFDFANEALELSIGRGGDQAIIKTDKNTDIYGGEMQVLGTRNKGRSRIIAYALAKLIEQSSKVLIMSHKKLDMDALGAMLGVGRIVRNNHKNAFFIYNEAYSDVVEVVTSFKNENSEFFINEKEGLNELDEKTLLIVVDTHLMGLVESREICEKANKRIVIDHHIRQEDIIKDITLSFFETNASSACELVTELLEYDKLTKNIPKNEAVILLAGIFVDTNRFSIKTGRRTYEAAAFLKENGADNLDVLKLLQIDDYEYEEKAKLVAAAEFLKDGIVITKEENELAGISTLAPKVVDELLEIKGVRASFIFYITNNAINIKARSLGDINVGKIMEGFGGGGHFSIAAAEIKNKSIDEVINEVKLYFDGKEKNESNFK
ncbi:MAG: DHH family phosphoesterase [Clostridiales Family XIII bacterium]|jgi:c-di-AMP phosphodiesterase-like protein|nr:DHH family phosphoesterase [Clostridiales Family XIII bacterium]